MVIGKVMGILDILVAVIFFLSDKTSFIPIALVWIIGLYLIIKGIGFALLLDFASILDVLSGIIIIISIPIAIYPILFYIIIIFLLQKGIFSLLS